MRNIFKFALTYVLFFSATLFAGPERYDHMGFFKSSFIPKSPDSAGPHEEIAADSSGRAIAKAVYEYNGEGQLIKSVYYVDGKIDGKNEYTYNDKGLTEEKLYNAAGELNEKIVYRLNGKGLTQSYDVFDAKNKLVLTWQFSYDAGRLTGGRRIIDKEVTETFKMEYMGAISVQKIYLGNGENVGIITTYTKDNKITRRVKVDNTGNYMVEYTYDKQGRLYEMQYSQTVKGETEITKTHRMVYSDTQSAFNRSATETLRAEK